MAETCGTCNGTGTVIREKWNGGNPITFEDYCECSAGRRQSRVDEEACPACNGDGESEESPLLECHVCWGSGRRDLPVGGSDGD